MREIKFRAWNENKKIMIFDMDTCMTFSSLSKHRDNLVMQFTGLKDKNRKEIYEGDIVKMICGCIGQVKYEGNEFNVFVSTKIMQNHFACGDLPSFFKCEVIGNIYENKELLEKK